MPDLGLEWPDLNAEDAPGLPTTAPGAVPAQDVVADDGPSERRYTVADRHVWRCWDAPSSPSRNAGRAIAGALLV